MIRISSVKILTAATVAITGERHSPFRDQKRAFQATGFTSSGAGAAAISIQGSLDGENFIEIGTISLVLNGATVITDGFTTDSPWLYIRAKLNSISGTNAQVTVWLGA